jgi:hypothetical protein
MVLHGWWQPGNVGFSQHGARRGSECRSRTRTHVLEFGGKVSHDSAAHSVPHAGSPTLIAIMDNAAPAHDTVFHA